MATKRNKFKNLLGRNHWTDFKIILQKYSLVTFYQDCSSHYDSPINMATRGQGLFSLNVYVENLKSLFVRNHWTDFNIMWQTCSFGDLIRRLFKPQERWRSWSVVLAWTSCRVQASFHAPSVALEWAATASSAMAANTGCTRNAVGSSAWQRTLTTDGARELHAPWMADHRGKSKSDLTSWRW